MDAEQLRRGSARARPRAFASSGIDCAGLLIVVALLARTASAEDATPAPHDSAPAQTGGVQGAYPERGLLFYPAGPGRARSRWAVGGIWQIAPMVSADFRYGLPYGFSVDARLQTVVLYNQLGGGVQWAARVGPFALGLSAHIDGFFGALGKALVATTSFDTVGWGLLTKPGAFAGLRVTDNSWLTLRFEAYFSPYQATKLGNLVLSPQARLYEGLGTSLIVEYTPQHAGVIYYGVSLYNTRANYPMLFFVETSTSSEAIDAQMLWYLGLLAGYEF